MTTSFLEIHAVQMISVDDVDTNFRQIQDLLSPLPAAKGAPAFVTLPENCLYLRIKEGEAVPGLTLKHPVWEKLRELARAKNFVLHLGSVPLETGSKLSNASVLVKPDGHLESTYRKIHLFDIELEGEKPLRESDVFEHGGDPAMLTVNDWRIGQSICYDLRFSDLYHRYALQGADLILVPSSFLVTTGKAHWEVLLRARAIESQAYVVAAAQAGRHKSSRASGERQTYGHSLIIDPWGKILHEGSGDRPELLSARLELDEISRVRRQIPMAGHRRLHRINP